MARNPFGFRPIDFGDYGKPSPNRKSINKSLRDQVWLKYIGNRTQGKCYCCRIIPIHWTNFQVGHNRSVAKGGKNHITNLRPICGTCNRRMGTMSIEAYRKKYFAKPTKSKSKTKKKTSKRKSKYYNPFEFKPFKF